MRIMIANRTGIEVGYMAARYPGLICHLYSPGAQRGPWPFVPFALDNGAYSRRGKPFDVSAWRNLLRWAALSGERPLWAVVPDVVADRSGTLERWSLHAHEVRAYGFRPALALQDGMTFSDVPDSDCMLFVGGLTAWKLAAIGEWCAKFPGRIHVGRVNTWDRLMLCHRAGAESIDGSGWWAKKKRRNVELARYLESIAVRSSRCDWAGCGPGPLALARERPP